MVKYTPTEERILKVLGDGHRHHKRELKLVLDDGEMNGDSALPKAICLLRKKLNPIGESILCEFYSKAIHYRHVRLIGDVSQ